MPERPPGWVDPLGVDQYEAMKEVRKEMHELKKIKNQKESVARRLDKVRKQLTTGTQRSQLGQLAARQSPAGEKHGSPGTRDAAYPPDVGTEPQEPQRKEAIFCTRGQQPPRGIRRNHQEDDVPSRS